MFITMLGDMTAFVALVFGYFFYWTIHPDFPPDPAPGPGVVWPFIAAGCVMGAWMLTGLARHWNQRDNRVGVYASLGSAAALALLGGSALLAGPWLSGLDPTQHSYPATVWVLVLWAVVHIAVGAIMQLYCIARSLAGRMTARYDIDLCNVTLYWHFSAITVVVTVAVIAGFPLVA
jgi:cytochrome c oxidase subunit I+III